MIIPACVMRVACGAGRKGGSGGWWPRLTLSPRPCRLGIVAGQLNRELVNNIG